MKLKIVTHGGISRSGKVVLGPIFSLFNEVYLPYNTPDLDWINSAYCNKQIDLKSSSKLAALHISCYSWYAYLGRHTNNRRSDFTAFHNNKVPDLINENYSREDNDESFFEYQKMVGRNKFIPVFTCDLSLELIQNLKTSYRIEIDEWYLRRDPIAIFNNWMSDDRINKKQSYSRMFNYKMFDNTQSKKLNFENLFLFIKKTFQEANLKKRQIFLNQLLQNLMNS